MTKEERIARAKKMIAEQLSNMIINDLVEGNGFETFKGWCEYGAVFSKDDECYNECVELVDKLDKSGLDNILWELAEENC